MIQPRNRFSTALRKAAAGIYASGLLAISALYGQDNRLKTSFDSGSRGAYISAVAGEGQTDKGESLGCRAFELRIGTPLTSNTRLDFIHLNEGHPSNGHRDGFATQFVYEKSLDGATFNRTPLNKDWRLELGLGPYFSMDTTTIHGQERDDKNLGALGSVAVLYHPPIFPQGLHLRAGVDYAEMPGRNTYMAMFGLGKDFGPTSRKIEKDIPHIPLEVSVMPDLSKTNHAGTPTKLGYQIEGKVDCTDNIAVSASYLDEGKDDLADRSGVAFQGWYKWQLNDKWDASIGMGPYLADNRCASSSLETDAIISMQAGRKMTKNTKLSGRFNRIVDYNHSNDSDMFELVFSCDIK